MPVYEYECDNCMEGYNSSIDALVGKLNKTNATKIMKSSPGIYYVEVYDDKKDKLVFALGEKGKRNIRRYRHKVKNNKTLYFEVRDYKFSELIYNQEEEKDLVCPHCKSNKIRRIVSLFKAILDNKDKREPRPGDELRYHLEYKQKMDEEIASSWVGPEYLDQYFND
ncbi:MAG TPA: hypothetical protein VHT73_04985 [Thermodesulfobacteriota bacterium]|nr:hypothetical protein [Thermodesulfobacteriota bacterium]